MASELAELAAKEQAMMDKCRDLLSAVAVMHVSVTSVHLAIDKHPTRSYQSQLYQSR